MNKFRNKKGMTLIEMLAVIAIVAVLVSIITPVIGESTVKSRAATNAANLRQVEGTLATLRVSNYDAFMTASSNIENAMGSGAAGTASFIINSIIPGLADAMKGALSTIRANNGALSFDISGTTTEVVAPGAKAIDIDGMDVSKDAQMEIYIMENQIVCMYNGFTKEDFADVAEDGVYDGDGSISWWEQAGNAIGNKVCQNGHKFIGNSPTCACGEVTNPDYVAYTCAYPGCGGAASYEGGMCSNHTGCYQCPLCDEWVSVGHNCTDIDICVTPDTLVTLANGAQKRVGDLNYGDQLKVWDFYTASYTTAPVSLIINHGEAEYEIIELIFADGTKLNFVGCHGAFNATRNEFVDIDANNVASYVGNAFVKLNGSGYGITKLVDYNIKTERNGSITLLAGTHHNAILNGILTVSPSLGCDNLFEPFEVGANLRYDIGKMQKDIATYGQYTYEDFSAYVTYEQFQLWGMANMKVTVGKGYATYEDIVYLITNFVVPNAA